MIDDIVEIRNLLRARPRFLPGRRSDGIHTAPAFSLKNLNLGDGTMHFSVEELVPMVSTIVTRVVEREPIFGCLVPNVVKALIERMSAAM